MFIWLISLTILTIASDIVLSAPTLSSTNETEPEFNRFLLQFAYNKYPMTAPILNPDGSIKYRIAIISDLDKASKSSTEPYTWISYLKRGYLTYSPQNKNVSIDWDFDAKLFKSHYSMKGRGLELSELVTYNGQLITIDDKTGLVYKIDGDKLVLWLIVVGGNGNQNKGMKLEWATVKDSKLYVGSHGIEMLASDGVTVIDRSLMWVKEIDKNGVINHLNWEQNFIKLREAVGVQLPGYVVHESCVWSDIHGRWFFLPRKLSNEKYDEHIDDTQKGTNVLLAATPDFKNIKV
ncbi:Hypothetical protein CINCED_3A000226 [Cinara cedri]|nr:Hypothetical protein CINCED_3A000226 [Cinara cedri]